MKQLLKDIIGLLTGLGKMDLLLYFAVLILIILVVSLIYIIKTSEEEEEPKEEGTTIYNREDVDLKEIITNIENTNPALAEYTEYEQEQEEKAIISYDELIARSKTGTLNYDKEEVINNEVSIKKINLDKLANAQEEEKITKTNSLFNYEKEEAFLKALQSLSELLN